MLCQECRRRPATVKITTILDNQKTELHLCDECARKRGELEFSSEGQVSLGDLLAALLHHQSALKQVRSPGAGGAAGEEPPVERCPNCGLTLERFTQTGKLGCSECLRQFEPQIKSVLRHVHGSTRHVGRAPRRAGGTLRLQQQVAGMRRDLELAVKAEDFERAAQLRDQIRELEGRIAMEPPAGVQTQPQAPDQPEPPDRQEPTEQPPQAGERWREGPR